MELTETTQAHYAGFWVRFIAACIDLLIYTPIYLAIKGVAGFEHPWIAEAAFALLALFTYAGFFASRWQASPGMQLLRFHICDTEGKRLSFGRAVWWGIVNSIGWVICFVGLVYLQSKFDLRAVEDLLRSCRELNMNADDCVGEVESLIGVPFLNFIQLVYAALALSAFLLFIWALSIALPRDKTGFNNLLCRTRFLKGRMSGRVPVTVLVVLTACLGTLIYLILFWASTPAAHVV